MPLILLTGGARSGKSAVAEALAADSGAPVVYVATAAPSDAEMRARIAAHRARRPPSWSTVEDVDPAAALAAADADATVLVDGLGNWLAGRMHAEGLLCDERVDQERCEALLDRVRELATRAAGRAALTIVVHEEAGLGPTPVGAATRRYLDLAGDAAQTLSRAAARVMLVVAGRVVELPRADPHPPLRIHGDAMVPPGAADFAVNVVCERPEWLEAGLEAALAGSHGYPDERPAVEAVATRHSRAPADVVLTNGAADAFWLLAGALRPHRAVCVHPSFSEPEAALRAHRHPVAHAFRDPDDFRLDPAAIPLDADLVVVGNPNNPTANLDPADRVAELCRPGRVTIVDEAFADFTGDRESLATRTDLPGLVVVRSLTKLWGLAGVRAGYMLAPGALADACRRMRPPWSVNALALAALRECSRRTDDAVARVRAVADAREQLRGALSRVPGVRTWPSATNFLLLRAAGGERVHERLLERGIAIRPCGGFPGLTPDHLRVAVRTPEANGRLAAAFAELLA